MTKSNEELIADFATRGATGKSARMEVTRSEDGTAFLWGYGWALYACRPLQGPIHVYEGWAGYSSTTTKHIRLFKEDHTGYRDYSVEKAVERIREFHDAQPGMKGSFGHKTLDRDGRPELQEYDDSVAP